MLPGNFSSARTKYVQFMEFPKRVLVDTLLSDQTTLPNDVLSPF